MFFGHNSEIIVTSPDVKSQFHVVYFFPEIYATATRGGGTVLVASGYRFCKKRSIGSKIHWFCSTRARYGCRAIIHTLENLTVVKYHNVHNH